MKTTKINLLIILLFTAFAVKAQPEGVSIKKNSSPPDPSAMLEIYADDKGLLIPRVAITASNTAGPITGTPMPANSLLVYNTNAAYAGSANGGSSTGFYYWRSINSTTGYWIKLFDGSVGAGAPASLASLIPKITYPQMKALTNSMTDNDLGTLVFVTTNTLVPIVSGSNIANPDFISTSGGSMPVDNYEVYGLWYLSKAKTCIYSSTMAFCWKYITNTSNGKYVSSTNTALVVSNNGCVNPN